MRTKLEAMSAEIDRLRAIIAKQQNAISYALDRIQTDPDLGHQASFGTEVFRRLCVAEAEMLGKPLAEVEENRRKSFYREPRRYLQAHEWEQRQAEERAREVGAELAGRGS